MKSTQWMMITLAALLISSACAVEPQKAPLTSEQFTNDVRAGGKLFSQHCASCHGSDAQGTTRAPSLHRETVQGISDDALVQFLTDGDLRNGMPSWSRLPVERRWQLTRYIKSFSAEGGTTERKSAGR